MERIRRALTRRLSTASEYAPLTGNEEPTALEGSAVLQGQHELPFSWMEYGVFALLGMAMLWAWYVVPTAST